MIFLISLIVAVCLSVSLNKVIRKNGTVFYFLAAVICILLAVVDTTNLPNWLNLYVLDLFRRGALGTALFVVVMYMACLKNGSSAKKMLMPIRGQLSIIASILCLCHNIFYGRTYFVKMFTVGLEMPKNQFAAGVITIILLLIMIPLFIMSFPAVRKKMKGKTWKKYQRAAYVFYGLLYVHIMLLMVPFALRGEWKYALSITVYTLVYAMYVILRLKNSKINAGTVKPVQILCGILAVAMIALAWAGGSLLGEEAEEEPEPVQTAAEGESEAVGYKDGVYSGEGTGYGGKIEVIVTIENGLITNLEIGKNVEDAPYLSKAKALLDDVIAQQDYHVDSVSGATSSSVGLKSAIKKALLQAQE